MKCPRQGVSWPSRTPIFVRVVTRIRGPRLGRRSAYRLRNGCWQEGIGTIEGRIRREGCRPHPSPARPRSSRPRRLASSATKRTGDALGQMAAPRGLADGMPDGRPGEYRECWQLRVQKPGARREFLQTQHRPQHTTPPPNHHITPKSSERLRPTTRLASLAVHGPLDRRRQRL